MAKKDDKYWRKKFEKLEIALEEKGLGYYRILEKDYQKTADKTINDISKYYSIIASGGKITLSEANKLLTDNELNDFRNSIDSYIEFCKENGVDQRWMTELENVRLRHRISRLKAMKICIRQHAEVLYYNELNDMKKVMGEIYEESYNRTAVEISVGIGLHVAFSDLKRERINDVISTSWVSDDLTFQERIWNRHRTALIADLDKGITQALARGESFDKLANFISKKYKVSKAQANTLIRTETAYMISVGQRDMYKELKVKKYEFVATLDNRTSEICRSMDGKIFDMSEFEIGVTAPPLHANCRSVTRPYVDKKLLEK